MGTTKRTVTRFSRNERQLAKTARLTAEDAVRSLLEFVNHSPRPWAATLPLVREWEVHGEAPSELELDELQAELSANLRAVTEKRYRLAVLSPLPVSYTFDGKRVHAYPPQDDLADAFLWTLLQLLADKRSRLLKRCPVCSRFFLAQRSRARFCGPVCQDAHFNERRKATPQHSKDYRSRQILKHPGPTAPHRPRTPRTA